MTDTWTDRLSDYLDDELDPEERRAAEAHLSECAECRATLAELEAVVARADALDDRPPAHNLWTGIASRIGSGAHGGAVVDLAARRRARRVSFSLPQLAAAALAFVLVGAGSVVWLSDSGPEAPMVTQAPGPEAVTGLPVGSGQYDVAVAELEAMLAQNRSRLDSATVRIVEQNLTTIDRAIAEARAALAADPSNVYLNTHLAATMRQKVQLLRRVAELVES